MMAARVTNRATRGVGALRIVAARKTAMGLCASQNRAEVLAVVSDTPFVLYLTADQLEAFASEFTLHHYPAGAVLADASAPPMFYIIAEGKVDFFCDDSFLCTKGAGDWFGDIVVDPEEVDRRATQSGIEPAEPAQRVASDVSVQAAANVGRQGTKATLLTESRGESKLAPSEEARPVASVHRASTLKRANAAASEDDDDGQVENLPITHATCKTSVRCVVITRSRLFAFLRKCPPPLRATITATMGSGTTKNLSSLPFLKDLPVRKIELLSSMLHYVPLKKGQRLFEEGSLGSSLYIVYRGGCEAVATVSDAKTEEDATGSGAVAAAPAAASLGYAGGGPGVANPAGGGAAAGASGSENGGRREVVLNTFGEGDFFGEISLVMGMPRTASILATQDSLLLELRKDDFSNFLRMTPSFDFQELMKRRFANHFRKYRVPFFESIPEDKYAYLASLCRVEEFEPGAVIFKEGEVGNTFYIIAHGEVVVTAKPRKNSAAVRGGSVAGRASIGADGELELSRMGPGKYFGEIALIRDTRRTATVRTITRCVILSITKQNFEKFFQKAPEALADFEVRLARYDVGLRAVIYHPLGVDFFSRFLEKEFAAENIHFWREARDFRHIGESKGQLSHSASAPDKIFDVYKSQNKFNPDDKGDEHLDDDGTFAKEVTPAIQEQLQRKAEELVQQFIAENAPEQVNINGESRHSIESQVRERRVTHRTFLNAEHEIMQLLERDSFARFKQSELFREFLAAAESYEEKSTGQIDAKGDNARLRAGSVVPREHPAVAAAKKRSDTMSTIDSRASAESERPDVPGAVLGSRLSVA
jgi:CRP-like cAMP-binding protein